MIALLPHGGFLSETSRALAIAQALRARGEAVAFASHGGPYLSQIEAAGFTVERLPPVMDPARCARFIRDLVQIGRPGVAMLAPDEVRAAVASEAAFLRRVGARQAVTGFTLTAYLSTRLAGIPLATVHGGSFVPPVFEAGLAPVPTQMPMPGAEWLPRRVKHWIANHGTERMAGPVRFLNTVAAELGVAPVPSLAALMVGERTLVTDVPEVLGLPADALARWTPRRPAAYRPGTRLRYTGPLFARLDLPIPPAVEAALDGARPTVYVVLSSSTPEQLRAVVRRVRASGARVLVGATLHDFGPVDDPEIVVAGLLPNHRVVPRVDLVVCMGGQGTVQTAMAGGTPLVAVPLHPEQELNVALAARQGMAVGVAPRHAGGEPMTAAVRRVLGDPAMRAAGRRTQALYAGWDGAAEAARALLEPWPAPAAAGHSAAAAAAPHAA